MLIKYVFLSFQFFGFNVLVLENKHLISIHENAQIAFIIKRRTRNKSTPREFCYNKVFKVVAKRHFSFEIKLKSKCAESIQTVTYIPRQKSTFFSYWLFSDVAPQAG